MIDVTFLLIVFFVVVSQIVDRDVIPLDLPTPNDARATVSESENRMVINVVPLDNGEVAGIVVGDHTIASDEMTKLSKIVKRGLAGGSREVHLRADRATKYHYVHQVIEAIRQAGGTPRLHLVVDIEETS